MKYVPPLGSSDENAAYVDGNPTAGIRGSVVPAAALEHPQREIMHVITQAGLEPSATTLTQLYQAITSIIGTEVPLASDVVAGLIKVGAGLAISEAGILSVPANAELEALRKSWIGVPRPWRSTTLPAGYVWANGGLVLFEDYPELEEIYNAGGLSGLLLAWDADEETIAANLGKWRPNSANPTGLFVPSWGGQFSRAWVPNQTVDVRREAGSWQQDAVETGITAVYSEPQGHNGTGPDFYDVTTTLQGNVSLVSTGNADSWYTPLEDIGVTRTHYSYSINQRHAPETRSTNIAIPHAIYLGLTI